MKTTMIFNRGQLATRIGGMAAELNAILGGSVVHKTLASKMTNPEFMLLVELQQKTQSVAEAIQAKDAEVRGQRTEVSRQEEVRGQGTEVRGRLLAGAELLNQQFNSHVLHS